MTANGESKQALAETSLKACNEKPEKLNARIAKAFNADMQQKMRATVPMPAAAPPSP